MPPGSLIILTVICVASLIGLFGSPQLIRRALYRPYWLVRQSEYSTLITSAFVHADVGHLLFNAITFYSFAPLLERRIGTTPFLELYFTGLLTGDLVLTFGTERTPNTPVLELPARSSRCCSPPSYIFRSNGYSSFPYHYLFLRHCLQLAISCTPPTRLASNRATLTTRRI
jgi:membrane associated rhomboid family serine protease